MAYVAPSVRRTNAARVAGGILLVAFSLVVWGVVNPVIGEEAPLSPLGIKLIGSQQYLTGGPASLRVVVTDHQQRAPVANALVTIRLAPVGSPLTRRLTTGRTNAQGTLDAAFNLPDVEPGSYNLIVTAVARDWRESAEQRVQLVRGYRVLLTSDKPLYQPGQVMHLRALALRLPDLRAAARRPITLEVADAKGNKVFKRDLTTDDYGIAAVDFQLADEVNMGRYKLTALVEDQRTEKTVTVERYVLPKFKLEFWTNRQWYLPGNQVECFLQADYFFGKPVAGAQVAVSVKTFDVAYQEVMRSEGTTDDSGWYGFDLEVPQHLVGQPLEQGQAFLQFDVEVTDTADHTERVVKTVAVAAAPLTVVAVPEAGELIPGQENLLYVMVTTPDGQPQPGSVQVLSADGAAGAPDPGRVFTCDEMGVAQVPLQVAAAEPVEEPETWRRIAPWQMNLEGAGAEVVTLRLRARTPTGEQVEQQVTLSTRSQPGGSLLLRTDRALARVGEELQAVAYTSPAERGMVYFDVIKERQTMLTRVAEVSEGRATLTLPLSPDLSGSIYVSAYRIMPDNNIVRDTRAVFVEPANDLSIAVEADRDTYLPGSEAQVAFTVTGPDGRPVASALGVNVVDESVFALQEMQPGMEKVYFFLEQELRTPRYEIHGLEFSDLLERPVPEPGPEPVSPEGEARRQQAARILLAAATPPELPSFFVDSYAERLATLRKQWAAQLQPQVERIQRALERWANLHEGQYPTAAEGLEPLLRAGYLTSRDLTDPWDNRLSVNPGRGLDRLYWVVVFSPGPDAETGTEDDLYIASTSPEHAFTSAQQAEIGPWGWGGALEGAFVDGPMPRVMAAPGMAGMAAEAVKGAEAPAAPGMPDKESVRIRQFFPETLFVEPALITGADGRATLTIPIADSITTWRLTALANSAQGALGSTTAGLRCFQDFFIDLDLPVALTQNDQVSLPVAIYNYLPEAQTVRLELTEADWFELKSDATVEMEIAPNNVNVRYFTIVVRRVGEQKLTVHGLGTRMSDAITRSVRIEPDGKRVEESISDRLSDDVEHTVQIPAAALADASHLFIKVFPGLFSTIVEGLDAILQMPFGCFEQTSSVTYPNVLVVDYMQQAGQITPEVRMKAEGYINTGYQRLVSYEVTGGGFSWFGSAPASRILSAYGLMQFHDMSRVHTVDESLIQRTQQWLVGQQQPDGSWKPDEEYLHQEAWSRVQEQNLPPTAYLTWALAWSGYEGPELQQAVDYLVTNRASAEDPYVLAMLANALVSADNLLREGRLTEATVEVLERLLALARREGDKTWWESEMTGFTHSRGKQSDLEATGMAAIAYITSARYPGAAGEILNYLLANKDPRGTWGSTQATVLALRAVALSVGGRSTRVNAQVEVMVNGQSVGSHTLTPQNSDVMWQVAAQEALRPGANRVQLRFSGEGTTLYQIVTRYYLPWSQIAPPPQPLLSIAVDYDRIRLATNDEVTAQVSVTNNTPATTSMVIVDLGIPPGFTVNADDLNGLVEEGRIDKYNLTGRQIIVYLERLEPRQRLEFSYRLTARFPIRAQTPVTTVYEYYNPENRAEAPPQALVVEE